jgi:hypothetical protein
VRLTGSQVLAGIVSLVVLTAIVTGIVMLGSPAEERARRFDRYLVAQLEDLKTSIYTYYSNHGQLPPSLAELRKETRSFRVSDNLSPGPDNRYRVLGAEQFELCGTFERESEPRQPGSGADVWQHPAGAHCFTLKVEKPAPK